MSARIQFASGRTLAVDEDPGYVINALSSATRGQYATTWPMFRIDGAEVGVNPAQVETVDAGPEVGA